MNFEADDLDITAELPQLDLHGATQVLIGDAVQRQSVGAVWQDDDQGDDQDSDDNALNGQTIARHVQFEEQSLTEELLDLRERVPVLEQQLAAVQTAHAALVRRYETLHDTHTQVLARSHEMVVDRERLSEERLLLLAVQQSLRDELALSRAAVDTPAALSRLRELQRALSTVRDQLQRERGQSQATLQQHQQAMQEMTAMLNEEQACSQLLRANLYELKIQYGKQEAAAAILARDLKTEQLGSDALRQELQQRERQLEALSQQSAHAADTVTASLSRIAALQSELDVTRQQRDAHARQRCEIQEQLALASQRLRDLEQQLDFARSQTATAAFTQQPDSDWQQHLQAQREQQVLMLELMQQKLDAVEAANHTLSQQLAETALTLQEHARRLTVQNEALSQAESRAVHQQQREAALSAQLQSLQQELDGRNALMVETEQDIRQRDEDMAALRRQRNEFELQRQQRDQFILEQAREIEQLQGALQMARSMADELRSTGLAQTQRIAELEQQMAQLSRARSAQGGEDASVTDISMPVMETGDATQADALPSASTATSTADAVQMLRTLVRIGDSGVVHLLNKDIIGIGRMPDNDIHLPSDTISRHHARLRVGRNAVIVEDLGSTNGIQVNGRRVQRYLLKDGDQLDVGNVAFRFAARAALMLSSSNQGCLSNSGLPAGTNSIETELRQ